MWTSDILKWKKCIQGLIQVLFAWIELCRNNKILPNDSYFFISEIRYQINGNGKYCQGIEIQLYLYRIH